MKIVFIVLMMHGISLFIIVMVIDFISAVNILQCKCGKPPGISTRIFGGRAAKEHEYPWAVFIEIRKMVFCGGVIINDLYILTAAHCIKKKSNSSNLNFSIYLHTKHRIHEKGIRYTPEKVIHFPPGAVVNATDVVLVKLNKRIEFEEDTYPICLPNPKSKYTHHNVTVIGWGITDKGHASNNLQKVKLTVMSDNYCGKSGIGKHYKPKLHLCAFSNRADACRGDSGGPLVYNSGSTDDPTYELVGLVSWGIGCGTGLPGVYSKISHYIPWINSKTKDAGYCSY